MQRFLFSTLLLIVIPASAVLAQETAPIPSAEKEHHWLRQFAGEWSTQSKAYMGPGQPPLECEGTIQSRMVGDLWVINELTSEMEGTTVVGIQTVGYDPVKKKYVGTWVDSMVNYLWQYEGTVDESGKILTLEAEGPNFMAGGRVTKFQDIYEFKSADEIAIFSKIQGEDGKWVTFMTGAAKRQKPAP